MSIFSLIQKEIVYRKVNFLLALASVAVATAAFLAATALLTSTDLETEQIIETKMAQTEQEMKKLENEIRKSMKGLGFNIYIFPEGQEMREVYEKGYASKTMPEDYVNKLANSKIVTINHLLPTLTQVVDWQEHKRKVILIGIRGEVPLAHKSLKKPLINPVAKGTLVLGYELHNSLGLKKGDKVTFSGKTFTIAKCHKERGTKDDITIWMNLNECQDLLAKKGKINSILALECNCATLDRLGEIREELQAILPGTKIIEKGSRALARAEARNSAKTTAKKQVEITKIQRKQLKSEREKLFAILIPVIGIACMFGVALLAFLNVKDRLYEVGLLLAIGIRSQTILAVFMIKAVLIGLVGSVLGILLALAFIKGLSTNLFGGYPLSRLVTSSSYCFVICIMPFLSAVSAWLPSFWAAQQDPAEVLKNE